MNKEELIKIQMSVYPDGKTFKKTHFNRAIQELYVNNQQIELSKSTKDKFQKIFDFCTEKLANSTHP
ncbi:hypothetical protein H6G54_03220 [Anabaena cylindrica FACHB-243]|uniref:Uncharacterized protein n=1 Tax=Anabaena cylindrica (strain ATCC 27899 / PCC 7122) TaxID=272123 RepID=K9ZMY3_ANACC|nr:MULTISPECIES: hypothetical protein [Anabaena]AFZ59907.1 hypothetical protein Anacy_4553 [Anabaena cylindrica PCC 7122]MBD2416736.1 hypothetical protein [Anabaena cylindrica FACHB-243]MBY5285036.1 hypothetical protein [Anabaena sp. CCAP 1446/1C]MBY5308048.1 hypothetical protein [Anabaena sp. CCAP 1446/1C]MCM2409843.1 hypothetical protein [Anabaena sp. CCAP 1446/1C]